MEKFKILLLTVAVIAPVTSQNAADDLPSVKVVSNWTDAFPGETVTLQCEIQNTSENWTYKWFKNGNIVSIGPDTQINGNTLLISVKPGQSGTYTYVCQAELEGRSVKTKESLSHSFKVHGSKPTISLKQETEYPEIYSGEQVILTCSIKEQTSPQWTYQWKKDNTEVNSGSQIYNISSATMLNKGSYTCHISRNGVTFSSEPNNLTIIEPPQPTLSKEPQWDLFYPTEKVTLTCSINLNPNDWKYRWYKIKDKMDNDISISGKTLTINSAKSSHSGKYMCKAKHLRRSTTTKPAELLELHISDSTPKPTIRPDPSFEFFYTDERVQLTCNMPGAAWEYHWYKDSKTTELSTGNKNYIINSASLQDAGEYYCKAKRRDFSINSAKIKVQVKEPPQPQLSKEPQWELFYQTETVTVTCSINENPNDWEYEWYKNKDKLSKDNDISLSGKTLSITSAKSSHSGNYTCKAKHLQRSPVTTNETEALQLHISDSTPEPAIRPEPSFEFFYTGEQVQLTCDMPGAAWEYYWYKDSKTTELSNANKNYIINSASLHDTGEYYCKAKRGNVSINSENMTLQVKEPPQPKVSKEPQWDLFYPTEKVTLTCSINENPNDWEYEWYRNEIKLSKDNDISLSGKTLSINSAKSSHSGSYKCKAKHLRRSPVTTKESEALHLNISDSTPEPAIRHDPSFEFFYTDEQVQFTCNMPGAAWEYHWYKDSKTTELSAANKNYNISSASLHDAGEYYCKAKRRDFSINSGKIKVQVKEPPQPQLSKEPQWELFYPTEKVTLTCSINENPNDWEYEWYKNEIKLSKDNDISLSGKTLSINSTKSSHTGSYKCKAKHLRRSPVTTKESEALQLHISDSTPKPDIRPEPSFEFFYTDERVQLTCDMPGAAWEYYWYKDSKTTELSNANKNYIINSASILDAGEYYCKAKRRDFSINSENMTLQVKEPPQPQLSKEPQWELFYPTEKVTLTCLINENPNDWKYEWYRNGNKHSKDNDISLSGKTLSITSAKSSHSGNYTCKAKHLRRSPVTTNETEALHLNISDYTPKPAIEQDPSFEFFYTGEQVQLTCDMPGAAWKYYWYKDSKTTELSTANKNYIINSASLHHTGEYHCKAKRLDFSIQSEGKKVQVKALSAASLNLVTELNDIIAGNILTLNCEVLDDKTWNFTWFENNQELNESSSTLKVKSTEETIKNEFKCRGKRTERPLQSSWSEGFKANNILFKRKILLAISGCFVCCFVILIIGCIVLKVTRKPEKKEPVHEDLFISLADSKNQTTSPLMEYMGSKPLEKESEEKEELQLDRILVTHVDGVIMDEDSPSEETNDLTSFK
ncbi:obscurin [Misgurnus anguillicaudatus]|uniref:obscurin n=1 Tax=Misgurnus anguillicaudatus TaxID=75329 RepID=UPI003CCF7D16